MATKHHLILLVLTIANGNIKWEHRPNLTIKVPAIDGPRHPELHDTLQRGLFVEVLSAAIWNEPRQAWLCLMEADNLDQAEGMADHDMHLAAKVHHALHDT